MLSVKVSVEQVWDIHALVRDNAGDKVRRGYIKGRVDCLDVVDRCAYSAVVEHLARVTHLYNDVLSAVFAGVRRACDIVRQAKIFGQDSYLQRSDLVGDVAVKGDAYMAWSLRK